MTRKDDFVLHAQKAADRLLGQAVVKPGALSWSITKCDAQGNLLRKHDYSLMSGLCGIIYFLAELYSVTRDPELHKAIEKSLVGLQQTLNEEPSSDYGLYSGKMGVAFLYIRLFEINGEQKHLSQALKIAKEVMPFLDDELTNNSLYEGRAGVLLILAAVHKLSPDEEILGYFRRGVYKLLWDANYLKNGLSWYYNQTQTGEVLGWGYGSAGISFVLEAIGRSFDIGYLTGAAAQAHRLIDKSWNDRIKNWPDHHFCVNTPAEDKKLLKAFKNKAEVKKILSGKDTIDFSDGLIGIQYARSMHRINRDRKTDGKWNSISRKLAKSKKIIFKNPENAGAYLTLMRNYAPSHLKSDLGPSVSLKAIQSRLGSKNPGLCDGLAGWGYCYLIAADKVKNPYFCLDMRGLGKSKKVALMNIDQVKLQPFAKYFTRTLSLVPGIKDILIRKVSAMGPPVNLPTAINALLGDKKMRRVILKDAHKVELTRYLLMDRREHCSLFFNVGRYNCFLLNRVVQKLPTRQLFKMKFQLDPSVKIVATETDLGASHQAGSAAQPSVGRSYFLLKGADQKQGTTETLLSGFDELLLSMTNPVTPGELLRHLKPHVDVKGGQQTIERRLADFILAKVQEGILVAW
jgi:hypothetical protein